MGFRCSFAFMCCLVLHTACRKTSGTIADATTASGLTNSPNTAAPTPTPAASANPNIPATTADGNQAVPSSSAKLSPEFLFSPYKDVTISANWNTSVISTAVSGKQEPLLAALGDVNVVTWSFATGTCGNETWGGVLPDALVQANLAAWVAAKKGYIISTGGAAGAFTCRDDAGWLTFLKRYESPFFVGVDFDVEAGQSQADIEALVARIKTARASEAYKNLRFSFTIATLGGSVKQSLGAQGVLVMNALKAAGMTDVIVNLMTMDYGSSLAANCVLDAAGGCNMGLSAIQAAKNLHEAYAWPYDHMEVTPMLGGNDTPGEVFTLEDVKTVAQFVRQNSLIGLHLWSWDRDVDCAQTTASPICNSYGKAGILGFHKAMLAALSEP